MVVEPDGRRSERVYWDPPHERVRDRTADDWRDALLDALRVAVRRRMVSDVPVGILLSGGLDSSLIVALLAEQGQHGLATFSIGFPDAAGARATSSRSRTWSPPSSAPTTTRSGSDAERLVDALPQAIDAMSEPMVSHDCVAFWLLCRGRARERKVVQSGQGADEVLGGYGWYPPLLDAARLGLDVYAAEFFDRDDAGVRALLADAPDDDVSLAFARDGSSRPGAATPVDRALRLDTEVMLVDDPVKRVDNMTMAHGLEARTPFLDHELVELAAACPPELKLADGGKGVLKAAARGVVPDAVIDRQKGYFPVPALTHLEGPVLSMVRTRCAPERATAACSSARSSTRCSPTQRAPHEPRRLVAVAARPARAVAAAPCGSSAAPCGRSSWSGAAKPAWRWATTSRAAASTSRSSKPATAGRGVARPLGLAAAVHPARPTRSRAGLPGRPDRYPTRDEVVAYLTGYAAELPVEYGSRVRALRRDGEGFRLELAHRDLAARQVVVATGPFQVPRVPALATGLAPEVRALHASAYRRPADLPEGPVLVVGGGNTGFQIAEELVATREVHLAIGSRQTPIPQRMLGSDVFDCWSRPGSCA